MLMISSGAFGIGINLQLPADAQVPEQRGVTDLAHALDTAPPTRATVLAAVLAELRSLLDTYAAAGFVALRDAWQQRNAFADLPVCISGEAETLQGICRGVDEDGALLLETAVGMRRVLVGDVSLRAGGGGQA